MPPFAILDNIEGCAAVQKACADLLGATAVVRRARSNLQTAEHILATRRDELLHAEAEWLRHFDVLRQCAADVTAVAPAAEQDEVSPVRGIRLEDLSGPPIGPQGVAPLDGDSR